MSIDTNEVPEDEVTPLVQDADGQDPDGAAGQEAATDPVLKTGTITWHDRQMKVRFPNESQLIILKRLAERYGNAATLKAMDGESVMAAFDRCLNASLSLVCEPGDRDYVEDEILKGAADLPEAAKIMSLALDALKEKNAEVFARTGKAKAATRGSRAPRQATPASKATTVSK